MVKLLIHSQTWVVKLLKLENGSVISSHILVACDYISMLGLKLIHFSERGPMEVESYGHPHGRPGWACLGTMRAVIQKWENHFGAKSEALGSV